MHLSDNISAISGVGDKLAKLYSKLGLSTVEDLLTNYPRKYNDYSKVETIDRIKPGQVSIKSKIKQIKGRYIRGGLHITEAVASDETGSVRLVWFNQPYRANGMNENEDYYISGLFEFRYKRLSITNPATELVSSFPINTARIIPIYRETKGLTSRQIRKSIKAALSTQDLIPETLPPSLVREQKLISRSRAIKLKHFPNNSKDLIDADERLGFEELFEIILASQYARRDINQTGGIKIDFDAELAKAFTQGLPFTLTDGQKKAIWQSYIDIGSGKLMNRLIEGDVGSGKTVVATMIAVMVMSKGYQVALLAPTEILAQQHASTIRDLLKPLGQEDQVVALTGSLSATKKNHIREDIKQSKQLFVVGTHALIQDSVDIKRLALVIVDEQHRFGVEQRQKLLSKVGHMPHMLSLTATPIPRSLALTIFGELDISILSQKPKNRLPIITELVKPTDRQKAYKDVTRQLESGRQVFVVCPLINESDVLQAKSVENTFSEIEQIFKEYKVDLLHGRMKADDKQRVMEEFTKGKTHILVSTTVIEVGVDIPNATVMLIEAPERFGLAQLHQLRGRVGRSSHQGYCHLMLSDSNSVSRRLRAIESTNDGFKLAELDLEIRGAGSLYGTSQHGELDLKIADFTDTKLIARAQKSAKVFMQNDENLLKYPYIKKRIHELQSVVHLN